MQGSEHSLTVAAAAAPHVRKGGGQHWAQLDGDQVGGADEAGKKKPRTFSRAAGSVSFESIFMKRKTISLRGHRFLSLCCYGLLGNGKW